jgi:hypothetical protein
VKILTKLKGQASVVRDRETIDSELRLLAAVRRVCREHGGTPSIGPVANCWTSAAS